MEKTQTMFLQGDFRFSIPVTRSGRFDLEVTHGLPVPVRGESKFTSRRTSVKIGLAKRL